MPSAGSPPPFPPTTYAMWRDGIAAELGPDALTSRLRAKTEDGIPIEPLYAPGGPGDGEARTLAGRVLGLLPDQATGWRIRQRFALTAPRSALADALAGGVQSLEFLVEEGDRGGRQLAAALDGLELGDVELSFEGLSPADLPLPVLESFTGPVSFGVDPIGRVLQRGGAPGGLQSELASLGRMTLSGNVRRLLRASGDPFFDAGGTTGMTLGATLAVALAYWRALEEGGADPGWAAGTIEVRLPCGPRFFESIAMLRAARLVWARMLELGDITAAAPLQLVATSGRRTLTRHDPWVNALRNSAAVSIFGDGLAKYESLFRWNFFLTGQAEFVAATKQVKRAEFFYIFEPIPEFTREQLMKHEAREHAVLELMD